MSNEDNLTAHTEDEPQTEDELSSHELAGVVGGVENTKHPAKVAVPDLKLQTPSGG